MGDMRSQHDAINLAVVIDNASRCPGFMNSIVGLCREIYGCFDVNFNIRLVIAFCGSGTQLFQQETEPFRFATDPSRAEHVMIVPGTGDGLDFANAIVQALNAKAGSRLSF
jgi:hypothetical protein